MACGHNGAVVIIGEGKGGCLICHRRVILAERMEKDTNFMPALSVPVKYWADDPDFSDVEITISK